MKCPKVAVMKAKPETVLDDYSRLMEASGYRKELKKGIRTLIKLNLSWSLYFPACSTEPWQLESVLSKLRADGYKNIAAVENKTVVTDPLLGLKNNKWENVLKSYNVPFCPLTKEKWISFKPKSEMLALDRIFRRGFKIPEMFIGTNVLHLPTLKTHGHTTITGAMKNAFGGLLTEKRHHCHKLIHEVLVDLLAIQKDIHKGIFAVTDGTVAGSGKGPRTMKPVSANLILASSDQVAIDAVSAKLMGFDPMKIKFLKKAHDMGLGCADLKQIDFVGDDIKNAGLGFRTGKSPVIFFDQLFRKGALKFLEPLIFHSPLFKLAIFASGFYHDKLWYNTVGRARIRAFKKTRWGKLFSKY